MINKMIAILYTYFWAFLIYQHKEHQVCWTAVFGWILMQIFIS